MRAILLGVTAIALAGCKAASEPTVANEVASTENEGTPASSSSIRPSFDCDRAEGQAQQLVCNVASLAQMDVEMSRLYSLAEATNDIGKDRLNELKAMQRGWIKGRDDCWKSDDLRQCVVEAYVSRIHELREGYANARSDDSAGISSGPVAFVCEGIEAGISGVFVDGDPGAVSLKWRDTSLALERVESNSGAKYSGKNFEGAWTFWSKGRESILTHPAKGDLSCEQDEIG